MATGSPCEDRDAAHDPIHKFRRPAGDPSFYENKFDLDHQWGMDQGDAYFSRRSDTFETLKRVAGRLEGLGIAHAAVGALAFFEHGYRRFTTDVDLLVTADGLRAILDRPEAIGCVVPPTGRDQVRDVATGVRIDFLVAGRFPGDRKPGPVAFPDPGAPGVAIDFGGVMVLDIARLVEIGLASGLTGGIHRMKDTVNVIEWIKVAQAPESFADRLHPSVRDRYAELWTGIRDSPKGPVED